MEYGLDPSLPIYAGGLGILAGDYLKSAADLNLPVVGVGILWRHDYTKQLIGTDGHPYDLFPYYDYDFVKDTGKSIDLVIRGETVTCKIRMVNQFGNVPLYLLDASFPGSRQAWITEKLYGGTAEDRVAQEMVLGIGGIRALRALGLEVDLYHFNEGHAFFATLELMREKMSTMGLNFSEALEVIRPEIIFTTHTPVAAGNESHAHQLLQDMGAYNDFTYDEMCQLGGDPFNMTAACLRVAQQANAVSKLHRATALRMWGGIDRPEPIKAITNGVDQGTWQMPAVKDAQAGNGDLWSVHQKAKLRLIDFIEQRTHTKLKTDVLTVGFARRAAPYKRSELIFRRADVLEPLLLGGRLQLVFSGKAHPNDQAGKEIIQRLVAMDRRYETAVVFLENYDMEIARYLVQGSDVWLNNPLRPLEASGTSGMKAALNGVLNLSVADGWVVEGVRHGENGWLLDEALDYKPDLERQDEYDLEALYKVLLDEVVPLYYNDHSRWLTMMRASIEMAERQFTSKRMVEEYYRLLYLPAIAAQRNSWRV